MADTNTTINLEGTDWISDIPGVYFDASSELVKKLGSEQAGNYIARIGLGTGTVIDLTINIIEDPDNLGKIIASTSVAGVTYYISGITVIALTDLAIGAALAITGAATAPVWLTVAGVGAAVAATTYYGSELKEYVYNTLKDSLSDFEEYGFHSPEMVGTITKDAFISQSATNDPDFCKNIFPDYINYRQITEIKSGTESFLYNQLTKDAVITTSQSEKDATEVIFKNTDADKLTLNKKTFDIRNLNSIQLRNAINGIDSVSFLLSKIIFHEGEKFDLGSKGIYTATDTDYALSLIAQNHNMTTKEIVALNPWLFDDNRIVFNYPTKVLVAEGTKISSETKHTLIGENANDILIDHNGGDDTIIGNDGDDHLDGGVGSDTLVGGTGYDTYIADNGDMIFDEDGKGTVTFEGLTLTGGKEVAGQSGVYQGSNGETYTLTSDSNLIVKTSSGATTTIYSFNQDNNDLGITLEDNKKDISIYVGDATVLEGGVLEFTVGIDNTLEEDLVLNVESYFDDTLGASADDLTGTTSGTITIKAGETSGTFEITTNDDTDMEDTEKFTFAVTGIEPYTGNDMNSHLIVNAGEGTIDDNDDETVLHVNITSVNTVEGDLDDNNQLTFIIGASRELKDGESVTLELNINDITTDGSDYGFLSQDTITLNSTNQYQTITLDVFGDEEKEASETLSLNATVATSTGVSDVQIISDEATIYDDDAGATPYDDFLTLTDEADTMDALAGDDVVFGKGGNDYIDGNSGNDLIFAVTGIKSYYVENIIKNISTCRSVLVVNNYLHVERMEVA